MSPPVTHSCTLLLKWLLLTETSPDSASPGSDHEDNGRIGRVGGGVVDIKHKTASAVRGVDRTRDQHPN